MYCNTIHIYILFFTEQKKYLKNNLKKLIKSEMNLKGTSYGNGLLFAGFNQDQGTKFFYKSSPMYYLFGRNWFKN